MDKESNGSSSNRKILRKPEWLKSKLPSGKSYLSVKEIVNHNKLNTICESGKCPNIGHCWGEGTATFMILGDICTRSCRFCAVKTGKPDAPSPDEPGMVAKAVKLMKLRHCVLTSVDRDDLADGGAAHWAETVKEIRAINPHITLETLIPDFKADINSLNKIIDVKPEIVSHNLETVSNLTKKVRNQFIYSRSLKVLSILKNGGLTTKSGIMVGLGETREEVTETIHDLINSGCDIITIGQYLQPSKRHLPVSRYVTPDEFKAYEKLCIQLGFKHVESAPLVRSSYHAENQINN